MASADDPTVPDLGPQRPTRIAGLAAAGERVGGYVVEGRAGSGGMAVVFRARDPELDRPVALKLIVPEYADDPAWRARFMEESRAIAALEHPNVVPVYERGEDGGRLFIAMRFVDGRSLADLIHAEGGLPAHQALRVVEDLAGALDAAHRRGIVHGDVKPGNVLVSEGPDGRHVYLSDFGLVARGERGPGVVRPLGWAGTPGYAAPELIRTGVATPATDVYALGCLLVQALTGAPPFTGDLPAVLAGHLADPPPAVTARAPGLPPDLDAVVRRALAKRPGDRFASAGELAAAARAARHPLVLLHAREQAAEAGVLAAALADDGVAAWWTGRDGGARGERNAVGCARAVVMVVGAGGPEALGAERLATARMPGPPGAVLVPGAGDAAVEGLARVGARPVVDMRAALDDPDGHRRLLALAGVDAQSGAAGMEGCPYQGLAAYDESRAEVFVGRERETEELLAAVAASGIVVVVGDSGSGKSSLVRAGLVPAVRAGGLPGASRWEVRVHTPGTGAGPADLAPAGGDGMLVVLDQFEEVFSPEVPDARRTALIDAVAAAAGAGPSRRVVCVMRADFMPACARHPVLAAVVGRWAYRVGPLSPAAVRRVVEEPAAHAGLALEPGLARRIADDVAERPGALPLLSHLLLELWRRRRGRTLTLEAYAASGGVEGALSRRANEVLEGMPPDERDVARRLLLRLVQPGEGTEDTRRRVPLPELRAAGPPDAVARVLERFAAARLLTMGVSAAGTPTAEVAHEALIRGWWVLREWVDRDRDRLRSERRLTAAARDWEAGGRDDAGLYRGALLAEWAERGEDGLSDAERRFLAAGHRREELEAAGARRRRRVLAGAAAAVIALLAAVSGVALWQRSVAAGERDRARAQVLVLQARELVSSDPAGAVVVARDAVRAAPGTESLATLRLTMAASPERAAVRTGETELRAVDAVPGGTVAAGDARGRVLRWNPADAAVTQVAQHAGAVTDVAAGRGWVASAGEDGRLIVSPDGGPPRIVALPGGGALALDVSPDGRRLAVSGTRPSVVVLDAPGWRTVASVPVADAAAVALLPDGRVALGAGDRVELWSTRPVRRLDSATPGGPVTAVAARRDGSLLLTAGDGSVLRWAPPAAPVRVAAGSPDLPLVASGGRFDLANDYERDALAVSTPLAGAATVLPQSGETRAAAVAPDGTSAVSAHNDGTLRRWDLAALPGVVMRAPRGGAAITMDAGGAIAAVADAGGHLRLRTVGSAESRAVPLPRVRGAEMSADGTTVAADVGGAVAVWGGGRHTLRVPVRDLYAAALDDDGGRLALVDGGRLRVIETSTGRVVGSAPPRPELAGQVRFLPGSGEVVVALFRPESSSRVRIVRFDPLTGALQPLFGPTGWAAQIDVAPAARAVAVASETTKSVTVWTAADGRARAVASVGRPVRAVAVSPDARLVASGSSDGRVGVWSADGRWAIPGALRVTGPVLAVRITDAGLVTASGADGTVRRWACTACGDDATLVRDADRRIAQDPLAAERVAGLAAP